MKRENSNKERYKILRSNFREKTISRYIHGKDFEGMALSFTPCLPRIYKRYVDDIFRISPTDSIYIILKHLNFVNSNIQYSLI